MLRAIGFLTLLLGTAVLLVIAWYHLTYIDETTRSGSAYGFTIGQSKESAYETAQQLYKDGVISGIETTDTRAKEEARFPYLGQQLLIQDARAHFSRASYWELSGEFNKSKVRITMWWHDTSLSRIGMYTTATEETGYLDYVSVWRASEAISFKVGDTYSEAYEKLSVLAASNVTGELVLQGSLRRQPVRFANSEYSLIQSDENWMLLIEDRYTDTIRLAFAHDKLLQIRRHRVQIENI